MVEMFFIQSYLSGKPFAVRGNKSNA